MTFNSAFDEVIKACAGRRKGRPLRAHLDHAADHAALRRVHDEGHAHSFEVWSADGRLVGGGYGLALGASSTPIPVQPESNTSKMGFASFNHHLAKWGFVLNDGKDFTPTIDAMGFRAIPRAEFEALLARHTRAGERPGPWTVEDDLATIAA